VHKYHTINTPESSNSHNLKIQEDGGGHIEFRKNVKNVDNSELDTNVCIKFYGIMHHGHAELTT